jgi:hypothetical protein
MVLILAILGGFIGIVGMAVADGKKQSKFIGFMVGIVGYSLIIVLLGQLGLFGLQPVTSPSPAPVTPTTPITPSATEVESEYGSSLTDCLQKSKEWFADAKATSMSVLADEEKRGFYDSYNKQKEIDSINTSLSQELADYQRECRQRFN